MEEKKPLKVIKGKRGYCRLSLADIYRSQLRKCGLDLEKIDWNNTEERALAREYIKKLYPKWTDRERKKFVLFYWREKARRKRQWHREAMRRIKKMKINEGRGSKKLSWVQIWEIVNTEALKKEVGRVGVCSFIGVNAWHYRCRTYRIDKEMLKRMTLEELKEHITNVMLEIKVGENWRDVLYNVWWNATYSKTPAKSLMNTLRIKRGDILGKTFEEFLALVKDRLWDLDKGAPLKELYPAMSKKNRKHLKPVLDDPLELIKVLERTNVIHAVSMASPKIYSGIMRLCRKHLKKKLGELTKEELRDYLLSLKRIPSRSIDDERELLKLLEVESAKEVLRVASERLYKRIVEYYRERGMSAKDITREHIRHYLKFVRLAKRDVKDYEELLRILEEDGKTYALKRASKELYLQIYLYCKKKGISLRELTEEDLKYFLCQRAKAI